VEAIGLQIEEDRVLPDLVVLDTEPGKELLVFLEVVASDGPISDSRKRALQSMAQYARMPADRVAYVTVYADRDHSTLRKTFGSLAWNTLVWLASEPDQLIVLHERPQSTQTRLFDLLPGV
jgi:hypothetical protein